MKSYYIKVGETKCPVSKQVFEAFSRMSRHERYLKEADKRVGIELDRLLSEDGYPTNYPLGGYQCVEDIAISHIILDQILESLDKLCERDRAIIYMLYLLDRNECEVARHIGISRVTLREQRDRIITALRKYIQLLK